MLLVHQLRDSAHGSHSAAMLMQQSPSHILLVTMHKKRESSGGSHTNTCMLQPGSNTHNFLTHLISKLVIHPASSTRRQSIQPYHTSSLSRWAEQEWVMTPHSWKAKATSNSTLPTHAIVHLYPVACLIQSKGTGETFELKTERLYQCIIVLSLPIKLRSKIS